ncbi:MAG: regulatory protein GemA [Treponema sp.]|jgi:hypothetical protein|nr:regulatory protein GemA [Treponema sp.]
MTEARKKKMIKLIHTLKTRAGIDDETYRRILTGAAGVRSSLDLQTFSRFSAVITALDSLLAAQGKTPPGGSAGPFPREVYALKKRAERIFGPDTGRRLGGYIRKLGKESLNELSPLEIRRCHGFLTRLEQTEAR